MLFCIISQVRCTFGNVPMRQSPVRTDEIDRIVHDATMEAGAYPAPYNYHGFPKSVCTSVNEVRQGL